VRRFEAGGIRKGKGRNDNSGWRKRRAHDWTSLVTLHPESPRLLQLSHLFLNND
jgi:hypothetical protein